MKKIVAVSVTVLAAGWLGATWYTGKMLEGKTTDYLTHLNTQLDEQMPPGLEIELTELSFERGFFGSRARYAINLTYDDALMPVPRPPNTPAIDEPLDMQWELDVDYTHGPFPASALASGQFLPQLVAAQASLSETESSARWFEMTQGQPPLTLAATVSYDGNAHFTLDAAALKTGFGQNAEMVFNFSGAQLTGTLQARQQNIKAALHVPQISIENPEGSEQDAPVIHMRELRMQTGTQPNRFGTQSGTLDMSLAYLGTTHKGKEKLVLEQLSHHTVSTDDEQFINSQSVWRIQSLAVDGIPLGSPSMTAKIDRLDGQSIKQLEEALNAAFAQMRSTRHTHFGQLMTDDLKHALRAVLAHNPVWLQTFSWESGQGQATITLNATLAPFAQDASADFELLGEIIQSLTLDVEADQPMLVDLTAKTMQINGNVDNAEQAQQAASEQINQGVLITTLLGLVERQDNTLKSRWAFDGSTISVNDREMPLEDLLEMLNTGGR